MASPETPSQSREPERAAGQSAAQGEEVLAETFRGTSAGEVSGVPAEEAASADAPSDAPPPEDASGPKLITLHVLSPNLPERITFRGLPISTTIQELKVKVCDTVESRPPADQQRLIYQGRPLMQGATTLETLFGAALAESDTFSIHLVLPAPVAPHAPAAPRVAPPYTSIFGDGSPVLPHPHHPNTPESGLPPLRPSSTGQLPNELHPPHHHRHQHPPNMHPPFFLGNPGTGSPPAMHQAPDSANTMAWQIGNLANMAMAHHEQAVQAATAGDQGADTVQGLNWHYVAPNQLDQPGANNAAQRPQPQQGPLPMHQFQQAYNQQHQARMQNRGQQSGGDGTQPGGSQNAATGSAGPPQGLSVGGDSALPLRPASANAAPNTTTVQENGQGRIVIQHYTRHVNPVPQPPTAWPGSPNTLPFFPNFQPGNYGMNAAIAQAPGAQPQQASNPANLRGPENTPNTMAYVLVSPEGPRALLVSPDGAYASPGYQPMGLPPLPYGAHYTHALVPTINGPPAFGLFGPAPGMPPNVMFDPARYPWATNFTPLRPDANGGAPNQPLNQQPNAAGPHQPSGMQANGAPRGGGPFAVPGANQRMPFGQPAGEAGQAPAPAANAPAAPVHGAAPAPANGAVAPAPGAAAPAGAAGANANNDDPAGEVFRAMLGMGGHLWLLARLFGFFWLFTAGAPWSRTVLIGAATLLVFLAQNRALRPFFDALWLPVRRHLEGLLQEAGVRDGPAPAQAGGAGAAGGAGPAQANGAAVPPTPATNGRVARAQRQEPDGALRVQVRRVERAVALFLASLVPGIGERHIAARRARQDGDRAQAPEAQQQGDGNRAPENADGAAAAVAHGVGGGPA